MKRFAEQGYAPLPGFQIRYIFFMRPDVRNRLAVPVIPYSRIDEMGAGMYLGEKRAGRADSGPLANHAGGGGANPTSALQPSNGD